MRIVCLSTLGVATGFVVDQLLAAFPATQLIRLHYDSPQRTWWSRLKRINGRRAIRRLEDRLFYRHWKARGDAAVRELLYGRELPGERPRVADLLTSEVNHVSTHALLQSLQPDLMITAGAPLLKPSIFSIPRYGTINVHLGIAPYYRGEGTLFWPLYFRDERRLGVTIHRIDRGIDTGATLVQGCVEVQSGDTEWALEAKAARLGAKMLVQLLQGGRLTPVWQPPRSSVGRQFNFSDRHVWHDAWVSLRRRWLRQPLRAYPESVVHFCVPAGQAERLPRVPATCHGQPH